MTTHGLYMNTCKWCDDKDYEPSDDREAQRWLCRWHFAEWLGMSLDGLDHMEAADQDGMGDFGYSG
jgi:hypothetical protein